MVAAMLRDGLVRILEDRLAALWLYGATAFGHPSPDVDAHAVLTEAPRPDEWVAIRALHRVLAQALPNGDDALDVWYIDLESARKSAMPVHLGPSRLIDNHWALHRAHWLAGRCVVLHGSSPDTVLVPPTWEEVETALRKDLPELKPSPYGVLQLCRIWASLETHDVVRSKLDSATWALLRLNEPLGDVVRAAARIYEGHPRAGDSDMMLDGFDGLMREVDTLLEPNMQNTSSLSPSPRALPTEGQSSPC